MDNARNRHTGTVKNPRAQAQLSQLLTSRGDEAKDAVIGRLLERGILADDPEGPALVLRRIEQKVESTCQQVMDRFHGIEALILQSTPPALPPDKKPILRARPQPITDGDDEISFLDRAVNWSASWQGTVCYAASTSLLAVLPGLVVWCF